jgi:hypothetical protein
VAKTTAKRKPQPRPKLAPDVDQFTPRPIDQQAVIEPPIVAEAATDVTVEEAEAVAVRPLVVTATPAPDPQTVLMPIDTAARISCGKVIARKCGLTPAAGQAYAQLLAEPQVRQILALQLETDPADQIRAICGI